MSDGFKIDKVGFYRQRDGGKRQIYVVLPDGRAIGEEPGEEEDCTNPSFHGWRSDGRYWSDGESSLNDLVAPWSDPPEPIPAGVWWDATTNVFREPLGILSDGFYRQWFPRRAEFPQGPPEPAATPWEKSEDAPFPALMRRRDKPGVVEALAWADCDGIEFASRAGYSYRAAAREIEWSPDNVTWYPCTREAVAAWRESK